MQHFDIWEYDVEGNTILDTEDVERAVYPFLGPKHTIKDVEKARKRLQSLYRKAGYPTVLVNIPEQDVVGGVVRLTVTQGKVEQVQVKGSRYFSLGRIRKALPALAKGQVPYLPDVQKQLTALNKATSDRQVTPVLRAGSTPGTLDVVLKVKDKLPLHGSVALDNENSAGTKPLRLSASVSYDNLWQRQHSFSFQYQTAPQDTSQVQVLAGTYVMPLDGTDDKLAFYAVR
ncbi:MAG TPA: POTRA domain-containing protein, partial [Gammaproteobacteria bacterium]|nr:POTRA domain-containing protein [Gammaproteobacteria bacterium]